MTRTGWMGASEGEKDKDTVGRSAGAGSAAPARAGKAAMMRAVSVADGLRFAEAGRLFRRSAPPRVRPVGEAGMAFLYPYGVVVTIHTTTAEDRALMAGLAPDFVDVFEQPFRESLQVRQDPDAEAHTDEDGTLYLRELSPAELGIVADVLSKSVVLDRFEETFDSFYQRIEPLADRMERTGRAPAGTRELVRLLGRALRIRQTTLWQVEVEEKPEITWERPDLDRLYIQLSDEYELAERHRAVERKVQLLSQTAETLLELVQNGRSLRVEWYILLLIVAEVAITLFDLGFR